jgi:hypothetical protein
MSETTKSAGIEKLLLSINYSTANIELREKINEIIEFINNNDFKIHLYDDD